MQFLLLYGLVAAVAAVAARRDPRNGLRTSVAVGVMWLPMLTMIAVSGALHAVKLAVNCWRQ